MKNKLSLAVITALCITSASAMQFQTLGYKSVSMGGAGVASSSGSFAAYNNPALLAKSTYDVEVSLGGGVSYQDHGASASIQALDESGFFDLLDKANDDISSLTAADKAALTNGQSIILGMNGDAIEANPQAYVAAQIGSFGFGVFGISSAAGTTVVSEDHDQLIFGTPGNYYDINGVGKSDLEYTTTSMEYAVNNGLTYLDVEGVAIAEVPLGYGHNLELSGGSLMIGGALKYMHGVTYTEIIKVDNSDSVEGEEKKDKSSSTFGLDIGVAYAPSSIKDLTVALVIKNLNSPEFDKVSGGKITLEPMYRAGVSYDILESLEVAVDYDLSANKTLIKNTDSQMLGGGVNWHPTSWASVRGGLMQNMDSNDDSGLIYTAGVGVGIKWLQIDLSGQYSSNSSTVDGQSVPEYAKVNLALISRW